MFKKSILTAGLFCALFTASPVQASADLQRLVDQTEEGGVLTLPATAVYEGNVVIDKPMTLRGEDGTVIRGDGKGNVITIKAPGVRIERLHVTGSSFSRNSEEEYAAIKVMSDGNILKNLTITNSYHGIYLSAAHYNQITQTTIMGQGAQEIAGQGNGIHVYYSNHNQFNHNTISHMRDGMFFDYSNDSQVIANRVSHNRYGLHYMYSDRNVLAENEFSFNVGGATLMHSKSIRLEKNRFTLHQGTRSFGAMVQACDDSEITDNVFFYNQRALYIDQSQRNRISGNQLMNNHVGIELWASSAGQFFSDNHFERNTAPVLLIGGQSTNHWSENGKGNRWGNDYPMMDLNQDGIGDLPVQYSSTLYKLIEENELVYLFLNSPAVRVYELLGRFSQNHMVMMEDPHPLMPLKRSLPLRWMVLGIATIMGVWLSRRKEVKR
ncbi:nitrous oxide reductase family maturation protein NosD [Ammoniphilus sp. YIM 78166]|uniref:nitrous oxide reductase family maturation protein NosD n=1 Tax=Ammoniphilus sp. YIM 78166 TaxID=1644106 RepID=UPI00106F979E|nr:nitrous oxide reductase family maturation protein NosD [Ammoniphilus sp. YIM 78166]